MRHLTLIFIAMLFILPTYAVNGPSFKELQSQLQNSGHYKTEYNDAEGSYDKDRSDHLKNVLDHKREITKKKRQERDAQKAKLVDVIARAKIRQQAAECVYANYYSAQFSEKNSANYAKFITRRKGWDKEFRRIEPNAHVRVKITTHAKNGYAKRLAEAQKKTPSLTPKSFAFGESDACEGKLASSQKTQAFEKKAGPTITELAKGQNNTPNPKTPDKTFSASIGDLMLQKVKQNNSKIKDTAFCAYVSNVASNAYAETLDTPNVQKYWKEYHAYKAELSKLINNEPGRKVAMDEAKKLFSQYVTKSIKDPKKTTRETAEKIAAKQYALSCLKRKLEKEISVHKKAQQQLDSKVVEAKKNLATAEEKKRKADAHLADVIARKEAAGRKGGVCDEVLSAVVAQGKKTPSFYTKAVMWHSNLKGINQSKVELLQKHWKQLVEGFYKDNLQELTELQQKERVDYQVQEKSFIAGSEKHLKFLAKGVKYCDAQLMKTVQQYQKK